MRLRFKHLIYLVCFIAFQSQAKLVDCKSCNTTTDFLNNAKANAQLISGTSYIYVSNTNTEVIKKFRVRYEAGNPSYGEPPVFIVGEVAVDNTSYYTFKDAMGVKRSVTSFVDTSKDIPGDIADSAWKMPANSLAQNQVINYYRDNQTWNEMVGNYFGSLLSVFGTLVNVNLTITVKFADGSNADFALTGIDHEGKLRFKFLKGTDKLGNTIGSKSSDLEGLFKTDKSTFQLYNGAANRHNYIITGVSTSTIPNGSVTIIDCHMDTVTKRVTCKRKS